MSYSETCLGEGKPFTILHSTMESDNETHQLDCLLLHVDPLDDVPVEGDSNQSLFVTVLEWVTFVTGMVHSGLNTVVEISIERLNMCNILSYNSEFHTDNH